MGRKRFGWFTSGVVALVAIGVTAAPAHAAPRNPTNAEIAASKRQVATAAAQVGAINARMVQAQTAMHAASVRTEIAIEHYDEAVVTVQRTQAAAQKATADLAAADGRVHALRGQMGQLAASAYMSGGSLSPMSLAMGGDKPTDLAHDSAIIGELGTNEAKVLAALNSARMRQSELKNAANAALAASTTAVANAAQAKKTALADIAARQQLVTQTQVLQTSLQAQLVSAQARAGTLQQERAAAVAFARKQAAARAAAAARARAAEAARERAAHDRHRGGGGGGGTTHHYPPPSGGSSARSIAVNSALTQLGKPYVWAGESPSVGFDCSGLVTWSYRQAGISLPHSAHLQYLAGTPISTSQLQPGDLVFWSYGSTVGSIHHVAIWYGNGQIIEAADFGIPVHVVPMYWSGYFGAARVA